jgi:hypothetical protein
MAGFVGIYRDADSLSPDAPGETLDMDLEVKQSEPSRKS